MTTDPASRSSRSRVLSVRVRITAAVAVLVAIALAGAGLIVYAIEEGRIEAATQREVEQELDEFGKLQDKGIDPQTRRPFTSVEALLRTFLERNVPDDDELLVGWVDGRPAVEFPEDPIVDDPDFRDVARPLAVDGGSTRLPTERGEVLVTSQPVRQGDTTGALLVVTYLDEDRAELLGTMRTYTIVAFLSLILITGAAGWQSGRLLRPLRTLRLTAEEIGASDLSRRIPEGVRPGGRGDDITALTRTVNGMLDRLEAAFLTQRQFLDDAGHELKTPLTVLRGHLELLEAGNPTEVAETRELLLDEVDRMARLVGDLILLAKSDRPDFLSPREVDPDELVTVVLAKARALGDRRWVLDRAAPADAAPPAGIVLDEQRLTQALLQLADNAVKHTEPGDEIAVGVALDDATVTWWVRDSGRGIGAEDRERIFERFARAAVTAHDEGFGLGLSIVAAIARAHGGRAYVDEPPAGGGARIVISLPVVRPDRSAKESRWPAS